MTASMWERSTFSCVVASWLGLISVDSGEGAGVGCPRLIPRNLGISNSVLVSRFGIRRPKAHGNKNLLDSWYRLFEWGGCQEKHQGSWYMSRGFVGLHRRRSGGKRQVPQGLLGFTGFCERTGWWRRRPPKNIVNYW